MSQYWEHLISINHLTDASDVETCCVRLTDSSSGNHQLAYYSCKLLPRNPKFATIEKECLAVKLSFTSHLCIRVGKSLCHPDRSPCTSVANQFKETYFHVPLESSSSTILVHREQHAGKKNANPDSLSQITWTLHSFEQVQTLDSKKGLTDLFMLVWCISCPLFVTWCIVVYVVCDSWYSLSLVVTWTNLYL